MARAVVPLRALVTVLGRVSAGWPCGSGGAGQVARVASHREAVLSHAHGIRGGHRGRDRRSARRTDSRSSQSRLSAGKTHHTSRRLGRRNAGSPRWSSGGGTGAPALGLDRSPQPAGAPPTADRPHWIRGAAWECDFRRRSGVLCKIEPEDRLPASLRPRRYDLRAAGRRGGETAGQRGLTGSGPPRDTWMHAHQAAGSSRPSPSRARRSAATGALLAPPPSPRTFPGPGFLEGPGLICNHVRKHKAVGTGPCPATRR
jgi:hypothetical protein